VKLGQPGWTHWSRGAGYGKGVVVSSLFALSGMLESPVTGVGGHAGVTYDSLAAEAGPNVDIIVRWLISICDDDAADERGKVVGTRAGCRGSASLGREFCYDSRG
jgi:hypothetical protein